MRGLNSVTLGGNLAQDSQLKVTQSGSPVLSFTVCVNSTKRVGDEYEDEPNFVDCVIYGHRAESVARYLTKGTYAALTGRIHQSRWQTRDGQGRSKLEVIVSEIHFESRSTQTYQQPDEDVYSEDVPF